MDAVIKKQILAIRETGKVNMFDTYAVQYIANQEQFYELVIFIQGCKEEYIDFLLYGDQNDE